MLGLLLYNISDHRIFSKCVHDKTASRDMQDEDHTVAVAQPTWVACDNDNSVMHSYNRNAKLSNLEELVFV